MLDGQLGQPPRVRIGQDRAGRVVRRVRDQQLRARRDQARDLVDVHPEVVRLAQRRRHRGPADVAGHRLVDREAGVRVDDLVALLDQGEHRVEHDRLGARRDDDLVGRRLDPLPALHVGGDRLAQRRDAGGGGVVRRPLVEERAGGSFRHVPRGVEVRLTHLEVDDVSAGGLERPGAGGRLEGGLGPDALHAARESHGATSASNGLIGLGCPSVPMRARGHTERAIAIARTLLAILSRA